MARADSSAQTTHKTFSSPDEAVKAVVHACQHNNTKTLLEIFGADGKDIVDSGDPREDKEGRRMFVRLAREKHLLIADPANPDKVIVSIGNDDWPFPVPLVRAGGTWHFDSVAGREEILARRVGANETNAIEICRGFVEAQYEYAQNHQHKGVPEYAQQIVSSSGTQNGLYWEPSKGMPAPAVPRGFARAAAGMASAEREPYHGYFFKILTAQGPNATGGTVQYVQDGAMMGGFALVAWPAEVGVSGVQTFLVDHDGTVYEKALGPETAKTAEDMTEYNPDSTWHPVQPQ